MRNEHGGRKRQATLCETPEPITSWRVWRIWIRSSPASGNGSPPENVRNAILRLTWAEGQGAGLAVVGVGTVFPEMMFLEQRIRNRLGIRIDRDGLPGHGGDFFENHREVRSIAHRLGPAERRMACNQDSRRV